MKPSNPPYLGAAYYPEDWPLEQIDADIALMKEAGCNVMRIGEFAWSRMEPEEGKYDFDWLHLVVEKLGAAGISVIMGTPTATPPVWLTEKHPEVVYVRTDGIPVPHGSRRHACPNSPVYRDYCTKIVTRMAEEFGQNESIIGWQIDNEVYPLVFNMPCACPVCRKLFAESMEKKYGTIQGLNAAWGTDLWSQTYQRFDQLPISDRHTWQHPSLGTAWLEFISDSYVDFTKHQADILHRMTRHPISTNTMPLVGVDFGDLNQSLDMVLHDHYNDMGNLWQANFWFDLIRPLKDTPFWNVETQTCWNGSVVAGDSRDPGFCIANSWMPIALGAEMNCYWLWRMHWSGQELMHGAVLSSAGRPKHIFGEVQAISKGFAASADFLNNTKPTRSGLAMHFSHRAAWMFENQPIVCGFNYMSAMLDRTYRPITQAQLRPDVILPSADLSPYRVIVTPFLPALDEGGLRERMKKWIQKGGTWIVGPMSDCRTPDAAKFKHAPYGSLEEWAGIYTKYEIPAEKRKFKMRWADGRESEGSVWFDGYEMKDGTHALATYADGPLAGLAAVTWHQMGEGQIVVTGTALSPQDIQGLVLAMGVGKVAQASENLLVVPRDGSGGKGMVVVEIENRPATLELPSPMTDLITGITHSGALDLPPYTVMVLKA
jgi:beta-galactosidase